MDVQAATQRGIVFLSIIIVALVASGCAGMGGGPRADTVAFDRGMFALAYADFTAPARIKCARDKEAKKDPTPACISFEAVDEQVRQAITDAPKKAAAEAAASASGLDLSSLGPLLLKLAPLAAMAAS
jgi:hypothetical protein